jgi:ATP/maltotriose-dependent transcriptional regulator MalT
VLYGRDVERDRIGALLDAARASRSGALVLRGEAGIGKTALLEDARDRATDMRVLSARGVEAESELAFAALQQLIRPALGHLDQLPAPQATALRAALGLAEGAGEERFLVFAACLSLLSELAERRPVLCLVDDAHWLDEASADALRFVARRLDAEGIVMLFAVRDGERQGFESHGLPSHEVAGLDAESAALLLARGAGVDAAPAVRDRLLDQTRGNALALVELPSVLSADQLAGSEPLPEALPMTRQLEAVFLERAGRLPADVQQLLLIAAADDSEDLGVVTRVATLLGLSPTALDQAEEADLVFIHGRRLTFRHPLVRSAVYGAATTSERRSVHQALAAVLADDEQQADRRVWHLASAALEHDEDVLRALDEAAARAEQRNGHGAAAKALERAAELTPDLGQRGARLVRAARNLSLAGRDEEAVLCAKRADPLVEDPQLRANLAEVRGLAAVRSGRPADVVDVLVEAAEAITSIDPAKAIDLLLDASVAVWQGGDLSFYLDVAARGAAVDVPAEDETTAVLADSLAGFAALLEGDAEKGVHLLGEARAWGERADAPRHILWASFAALWLGDATRFAALVDRAASVARDRGELGTLSEALGIRSVGLAVDQRYDEVSVVASEAVALAQELGAENLELLPRAALAIVSAVRGDDEHARNEAEAVFARATANGLPLRASTAVYALAIADMGRARWNDAVDRLGSLLGGESGTLDPFAAATVPDLIEAALRAGRLEEARTALPLFEARAGYSGEPALQPRLAVCRALLAGSDGEATGHYEEAVRLGAQAARPLDLARIQLLFGEHLRRMRRRSDARLFLRAALEGFERLGAEPWAERARVELRASGETARKRDPSTVSQLTPQELQVARFVSEGLSNKEVAAQLFLSPRTIDAHLRNVFAKLGVTSRTQLARLALGPEQAPAVESPVPV